MAPRGRLLEMRSLVFRLAVGQPCAPQSHVITGGLRSPSQDAAAARSFAAGAGRARAAALGNGSPSAAGTLKQPPAPRKLASAALPQHLETESDEETSPERNDAVELGDRITFLGAGQMGEALIRGFTASGVSTADKLSASVRSPERQKKMTSLGIQVFGDALQGGAKDAAENADIIVLGVKPIYMGGILDAVAPHITFDHLVVSIAAGLKIATLEAALPEGTRVVRVMPNTPCLIGEAASAYVMGTHTTEEDREKVAALMSSVGMAVCVEEHMIDAVTGLSGSGPAYVFQMLESLADGAVAAGLTRDKALALAAQTVIGSARMVFEASGDGSMTHPGVLKDRVTSPGGTTITGLTELENSGVRGAYIRAIKAAANRSKELSEA